MLPIVNIALYSRVAQLFRWLFAMSKSQQIGFTLIEVLISVLVLALGVIGAAGMQLVAMRTGQQSGAQSLAVQLATEMADKMRANGKQMDQADASNPYLDIKYDSINDAAPAAPAANCFNAACSDAQMAAFDVYEWEKRVKSVLPGGRVEICRDAKPWDSTKGTLAWCAATASSKTTDPMVIKVGWNGKGKNADGSTNTDGKYPPAVAITIESYTK